jgi:hypothetical protein
MRKNEDRAFICFIVGYEKSKDMVFHGEKETKSEGIVEMIIIANSNYILSNFLSI